MHDTYRYTVPLVVGLGGLGGAAVALLKAGCTWSGTLAVRQTLGDHDVRKVVQTAEPATKRSRQMYEPIRCTHSTDCSNIFGGGYECSEVPRDSIINYERVPSGERRCVPQQMNVLRCQPGQGRIVLTLDITGTPKCTCECNSMFVGESCDQFAGCISPIDNKTIAPLYDRVTGKVVQPSTVNLADAINVNGRRVQRYYCACKEVSTQLTGAFSPLQCVFDPAFAYLHGIGPVNKYAVGYGDSHTDLDGKADCGPYTKTRLLPTANGTTCLPILNNTSIHPTFYQKGNTRMFSCRTANSHFVPCNNSARDIPINDDNSSSYCGANGIPMQLPTLAPEAGACYDACSAALAQVPTHPKDTKAEPLYKHDVCARDTRTHGTCVNIATEADLPVEMQNSFMCNNCGVGDSKFWSVTAPNGPRDICIGAKPPRHGLLSGCFPDVDQSEILGPMCDRGLICEHIIFTDVCIARADAPTQTFMMV